MAQPWPWNHPTAMVSGGPWRGEAAGWAGARGGVGVVCAMPSTPNFPWVLLQMTRPGPGLPSPPLSGNSCPSTKLRSAVERGRAADLRPRQPPVPTGGGTPSPCTCTTPVGLCGSTPGHSLACVWEGVSICPVLALPASGTHLPVGQELGFGGVGAWLSTLPSSVLSSPPIRVLFCHLALLHLSVPDGHAHHFLLLGAPACQLPPPS